MIEIIKHGDPRKTDNFMRFQCENCGCIWKADHLDYKVRLTDWATYLYTANCPNCHEEAWIVKDGDQKEVIEES